MGAGKTSGLLEKVFTAGGVITEGMLLKFGSDDDTLVAASAATDSIVGVAQHGAASGEYIRLQMLGIANVKLGGSITRGAMVTSNGSGLGVAGAATNRLVGVAMKSGSSGDLSPVMLSLGIHT